MSNGLSPRLRTDITAVLGRLAHFENDRRLSAIVVIDERISLWADDLPSGTSITDRVTLAINYFFSKTNRNGDNGLTLFLNVLKDNTQSNDANYGKLETLAEQVYRECAPLKDSPLKINFVNRDNERHEVIHSNSPQRYWVVDGPAGYGKTTFLFELQEYYEALGWVCVYSSLPKGVLVDIHSVVNLITDQLDPEEKLEAGSSIQAMGTYIVGCLLSCTVKDKVNPVLLKQAEHKGIAIFIDNVEILDDKTILELCGLIVGINKSLLSTGFYIKNNMFRFFLSGRDIRRKRNDVLRKNLPYKGLSLSPFTFQYVEETVRGYVQKANSILPEGTSARIAAKLMYLCGGHPRLIAEILTELTKTNFAYVSEWLGKRTESEFSERLDSFGAVIKNYAVDIPELAPVINTLSVYRRFGPWLLRDLIGKGFIAGGQDEYQLANELTNTYLLHRENGCLEDSITQRLLNIRLRFTDPKTFQELCLQGSRFYLERLSAKTLHPVHWAVEYLYLCLQYAYYAENKTGADLRSYFFGIIKECMTLLKQKWEDKGLCSDFINALHDDWELEFFTNYFLDKNNLYQDEYRKILAAVEDNCKNQDSATCAGCARLS